MDSEKALLSQILQSKGKVYHDLQPREWWFIDPQNKRIFNQIEKVIEDGVQPDMYTVAQLGLPSYVSEINGYYDSTTENSKHWAGICSAKGSKAELARACRQAAESTDDTDEIIESLSSVIEKVVSGQDEYRIQSVQDLSLKIVDVFEERYNNKGYPGIETGMLHTDDALMGLQKQKLIIISARPSIGKSALAMTWIKHISKEHPVGNIILEEDWKNYLTRQIASMAKIDTRRLLTGHLKKDDFTRITNAVAELHDRNIYIYDKPNCNINEVVSVARQMVSRHKCKVIFIDYAQLIKTNERDSVVEQVGKATTRLKSLARELDVPIVALYQAKRETEGRKPIMSDIQHNSKAEQDANVIAFLWNKVVDMNGKYLQKEQVGNHDFERLERYLVIAKNKDGICQDIPLEFDAQYVTFRESNA